MEKSNVCTGAHIYTEVSLNNLKNVGFVQRKTLNPILALSLMIYFKSLQPFIKFYLHVKKPGLLYAKHNVEEHLFSIERAREKKLNTKGKSLRVSNVKCASQKQLSSVKYNLTFQIHCFELVSFSQVICVDHVSLRKIWFEKDVLN